MLKDLWHREVPFPHQKLKLSLNTCCCPVEAGQVLSGVRATVNLNTFTVLTQIRIPLVTQRKTARKGSQSWAPLHPPETGNNPKNLATQKFCVAKLDTMRGCLLHACNSGSTRGRQFWTSSNENLEKAIRLTFMFEFQENFSRHQGLYNFRHSATKAYQALPFVRFTDLCRKKLTLLFTQNILSLIHKTTRNLMQRLFELSDIPAFWIPPPGRECANSFKFLHLFWHHGACSGLIAYRLQPDVHVSTDGFIHNTEVQ